MYSQFGEGKAGALATAGVRSKAAHFNFLCKTVVYPASQREGESRLPAGGDFLKTSKTGNHRAILHI
jgi:hypothetical protein